METKSSPVSYIFIGSFRLWFFLQQKVVCIAKPLCYEPSVFRIAKPGFELQLIQNLAETVGFFRCQLELWSYN